MTTKQLKEMAKSSGVKMWQIADKMGISSSRLSVKMRHLDGETERRVIDAIYELSEAEREVIE